MGRKPKAYRRTVYSGRGLDEGRKVTNSRGYVSRSLRADDDVNTRMLRACLASRNRDPDGYLNVEGKR